MEGDGPHKISNSLSSLGIGELIQGGIQFRMLSEKKGEAENLQSRDLFNNKEMDREYSEIRSVDMEYDEFDPPLETRCARWACPYGEIKNTVVPASPKVVEKALLLNDVISEMEPKELVRSYFGLGISQFPAYLVQFLQRSVEIKLQGIRRAVCLWRDRKVALATDRWEAKRIEEHAEKRLMLLERILLKEDPGVRDYSPIIESEGTTIDAKFTRQEACREDHVAESAMNRAREKQDWFHRMWNSDGSKNMSGEEALWLKRNKEEREFRMSRILKWLERQTSPTKLKKGLDKIEAAARKSRSECFRRRNWAEIRYTKAQLGQLREKFTKKIQGEKP